MGFYLFGSQKDERFGRRIICARFVIISSLTKPLAKYLDHRYLSTVGYSYWTLGYAITRQGAQKLIDANPLEKLVALGITITFKRPFKICGNKLIIF